MRMCAQLTRVLPSGVGSGSGVSTGAAASSLREVMTAAFSFSPS